LTLLAKLAFVNYGNGQPAQRKSQIIIKWTNDN